MDVKDQIIEELQGLVEQLRREVEELKLKLAKATKDSSTSSKPPSSDIVKPPAKKKRGRPKKRKKGAQRSHQRKLTHRDRFLDIVRNPPSTKEAANLAARFAIVDYVERETSETGQYDLSQDYFRFMFGEGVEPTNNHSERQIRHCIIDRRITQGTRGEAGQRYHERMWTAIATCKKQGRNFFDFLQQSITAHLSNQPAPTLLAD